jgi:hypothetical protein
MSTDLGNYEIANVVPIGFALDCEAIEVEISQECSRNGIPMAQFGKKSFPYGYSVVAVRVYRVDSQPEV